MNPESSPFRPGQPVPVEFFMGRIEEIERLRSMVRASAAGRFKIGFVSGERGIGKSSLVSFVRHIADRDGIAAGCHVYLGGVHELNAMVQKTYTQILKESIDRSWHEQVKDFFGNSIRSVGMFGVSMELNLKNDDLSTIAGNFVPSMRRLIDKIKEQKKSLLLILDDINGLASSEAFAHWLKSTVDEIATSEKETRLCILIVGLEDRRQELIAKQPSLARVFELFDIAPWSDDEVRQFYQESFKKASASVTREDMDVLVSFTGGLPVLAHEIGDAVWRRAKDLEIESEAIEDGIFTAADIIGRKFLEPQVFRAIRSDRYRLILRKAASKRRGIHFKKSVLEEHLTDEEKKVLGNFLRKMKQLGALTEDPEVRGGYRFQNHLHALYFSMESQRAQQGRKFADA